MGLDTSSSLRYGMIGGGEGANIGDVHRRAAAFDSKCQLVAGCFSRDFDNTKRTGKRLGLDENRLYCSIEGMAEAESARKDKIDFVSIVTPNNVHYRAAKVFLDKGFHVVCDKPLTVSVNEAEELARIAREKGLLFMVTYGYTGYPMVSEARELIKKGQLGEILMVVGEYPNDGLIKTIEKDDHKSSTWRADPTQAGISNCIADVGSHLENMVSNMTGLKIESLCAKLDIIGEGRVLDTNGTIMVRYNNGASGVYWASQVAIGYDNFLKVRIFGTKGSIEWEQESPNQMKVTYAGQPTQLLSRGRGYLVTNALSRIPCGHPEGYYEAFANLYSKFADAVQKKKGGQLLDESVLDFPDLEDGLDSVRFIECCVNSSKAGSIWVSSL